MAAALATPAGMAATIPAAAIRSHGIIPAVIMAGSLITAVTTITDAAFSFSRITPPSTARSIPATATGVIIRATATATAGMATAAVTLAAHQ